MVQEKGGQTDCTLCKLKHPVFFGRASLLNPHEPAAFNMQKALGLEAVNITELRFQVPTLTAAIRL